MAKLNFPPQIKWIVANEAAERYSFYGMRSILVVFLVSFFGMERSDATADYHFFVAACYLLPLFGGYLADRFLGKYKTILYLSLVYCVGQFMLAFSINSPAGFYFGLALIAIGSGGIKPCVSANVGDQFKSDQKTELNRVFDLFYWTINFGSFFSTLLTPWTLAAFGPAVAFGIPGILMLLATFFFWLGRNQYVKLPPTGKQEHSSFKILFTALVNFGKREKGSGILGGALIKHPKEKVDDVKAALEVGKIFIAIVVFWALFDQHGSSWVLQATEMKLQGTILGIPYNLLPSQIAALNPIMVMILIPIFSFIIYPFCENTLKINLTPLKKIGVGMFLAGFSFIFVAIFQFILDGGNQISVLWQVLPFLIITMSEVMISITGLEFAYTQAPYSMKSTIMSFWLLTVFFGNMLTAFIAKINVFDSGHFFMFFAVLMIVFSGIFAWIAKNYVVKDYMASGDAAKEAKAEAIDE